MVLIVSYLYDQSVLSLLSQEDLAAEVARTLCSGIGFALAVPITTGTAALLVPAELRDHGRNRFLDAVRPRWYSFMPRSAPEPPSRSY